MYDYLIVGAGISGLFCAKRINQFYPEKKILIIERGIKIGGRLVSIYNDNDIFLELGGMRLFPAVQPYVTNLTKQLKINLVEEPYEPPNNIAFIRNKDLE